MNAPASQDVASSSSSNLARPNANVAPKRKPKPSPRLGRGKPKPRAMGSMAPINHHFSPLPELPPFPPVSSRIIHIASGCICPIFPRSRARCELRQAAEVDVVSRIVISCVVAHALHAWLLVSPSVTTRSLVKNSVANMRCTVTTRSLIRNPVANMRCACKASENPPRSLISHRSCIWYTRVTLLASTLRPSMGWPALSAPVEAGEQPGSAPPAQAPNQDRNWDCNKFSSCEAGPNPPPPLLKLQLQDLKKRRTSHCTVIIAASLSMPSGECGKTALLID